MHGYFFTHNFHWFLLATVAVTMALGFWGAPLILWTLIVFGMLVGFSAPLWVIASYVVIMAVFNIKPIRRIIVSSTVMKVMKKLGVVPTISETERTALVAGVVWAEKELFSGKPDFKK